MEHKRAIFINVNDYNGLNLRSQFSNGPDQRTDADLWFSVSGSVKGLLMLLLPIHSWGPPSDIGLASSRTLCWVQGLYLERISIQGTGHQSPRSIFSSSCPSTKQVSIRANLEFASKDFPGCLGDILQQCWAPARHHHVQRQPCLLLMVLVQEEPGRTEVSQAPCTPARSRHFPESTEGWPCLTCHQNQHNLSNGHTRSKENWG